MIKYLILLSFCFISEFLKAQEAQKISIQSGTPINGVLKPEMQNVFSEFVKGTIYFKNNTMVSGKFNYNFLVDEIQFLNEKGEKLALANPMDMTTAAINNRIFVFVKQGYYEVITSGKCNLLLKRKSKIQYYGKKGAYGQTVHGTGIDQYNSISIDGAVTQVENEKEAIAYVEKRYYLQNGNKLSEINDLKSFLKIYSKSKDLIEKYYEQNATDFKKQEDLERLTKFCNSLN